MPIESAETINTTRIEEPQNPGGVGGDDMRVIVDSAVGIAGPTVPVTTSFTFAKGQRGEVQECLHASVAVYGTIPPHSAVDFDGGTKLGVSRIVGCATDVGLLPGVGVTFLPVEVAAGAICREIGCDIWARQSRTSPNTWHISGDYIPASTTTPSNIITGATINGAVQPPATLASLVASTPSTNTLALPAGTFSGSGTTASPTVQMTIDGSGMGQTVINCAGITPSQGKAVLVPQIAGTVISNLTLEGAAIAAPDGNAAGVNSTVPVTLDHVEITGCQDGVLVAANVVFNACNFHDNGNGDPGNGHTHEIYISSGTTTASLTDQISTCGPLATHALKSKALTTTITRGTFTGNADDGTEGGSVIDIAFGGAVNIDGAALVTRGTTNNVFLGFRGDGDNNVSSVPAATVTLTNVHLTDNTGTGGKFLNFSNAGTPSALVIGSGCVYDGATPPSFTGGAGWGSVTGAFTQAGAGGGTLTTLTVVSTSGSAQTNLPISIGLPIAPGALASNKIQVLDSDGVTPLAVQEDNRASDLGSNVRFTGLTAILPSLTAGQTKSLTIKTVSGSPAVGTDILASDILATAYDCVVTINDHNGNTYTASARTGLAAGVYSNVTSPATLGTWRKGGGLATEYIVMVIPKTGGGTAHPQLRVMFDVLAYKAGTGAVSGGNPITAIRTDAVPESGWVQNAAAVSDDWYGVTFASGTNTNGWQNVSPSQTLTIGSNSTGANTTFTASSSLFTANSLGSAITDASGGIAVITGYVSGTQVRASIYNVFGSSSLTSGNYHIWGVAHTLGSRYRVRLWFGGAGFAQPAYTANLGAAWNGGTLTGGPASYVIASKMVPNYSASPSIVTNDPTNLNACGNNPVAFSGATGIGVYGNGLAGDIVMYGETSGGRADLGIMPAWCIGGLLKYDATAVQVIFGNADKQNLLPYHHRDPATGKVLKPDNGTDWAFNAAFSGSTTIAQPGIYNGGTLSLSNWDIEPSHAADPCYLPYLLTGDWYYLEDMVGYLMFVWFYTSPGYCGSGVNRLWWQQQMRGSAWNLRSHAQTAVLIPDASPPCLGMTKSLVNTWLENHYTATNSGNIATPPYPGALAFYINNTGAGKTFATSGPRWTDFGGGGQIIAMYQLAMLVIAMFHAKELGQLSTNGLAMLAWAAEGMTSAVLNTTEVNPYYSAAFYWADQVFPPGTPLNTWTQVYTATAHNPTAEVFAFRQLASTLTFPGALSGAAITARVVTGSFNTASFYVGGWIQAISGTGRGMIVSIAVNSPAGFDTITLNTTASDTHDGIVTTGTAFNTSSYAGNTYYVPWPAPGDAHGSESTTNTGYWDMTYNANIQMNQDGFAGQPASLNSVTMMINSAVVGGPWQAADYSYEIAARP